MLSSSESDPFTTAPPLSPSPPPPSSRSRSDAQALLIHGFPQERHSFRNVDRVRQRFKISKGFVQEYATAGSGADASVNEKKRKLGSRNASVSATESVRTVMWEKKKDDGTTSGPYLKTAKQMESASVGRTIPSSPTERGGKDKIHRRRTFAGYQQKNLPLPHIDLLSKLSLSRSSPASPAAAVVFQKQQPLGLGKEQERSVSKTQQLVLHRLSRNKRRSSAQGSSHRRSSLPQSVSRTLPNKILAGPLTTTTNTDPISNGISITQLSARSLELLIENGLSLVFKKLEMNHGFASDTVKRAWLRCNGDIEATDGLLLTMRKAAEKAEASFLNEWDEFGSFVVEEEETDSEDEEERMVKRPRWSEPHISPQSDSIDSRYAPHQLSSDHELVYPEEEEYTPPVGTKAEMYKRLTEQGRHDEARKFLIHSMTPRKSGGSSNSTPKNDNPPSTETRPTSHVEVISAPSLAETAPTRPGTNTESRHPSVTHQHDDTVDNPAGSVQHHETTLRASTRKTGLGKVVNRIIDETPMPTSGKPISSRNNTESRNGMNGVASSSGGRISNKIVHQDETTLRLARSGKAVDRMEEETTTTTTPVSGLPKPTDKPIRSTTNTEFRNHQHGDQTRSPSRKTQTNASPPTMTAVTNKNSSPSSNSDGGPEWTLRRRYACEFKR